MTSSSNFFLFWITWNIDISRFQLSKNGLFYWNVDEISYGNIRSRKFDQKITGYLFLSMFIVWKARLRCRAHICTRERIKIDLKERHDKTRARMKQLQRLCIFSHVPINSFPLSISTTSQKVQKPVKIVRLKSSQALCECSMYNSELNAKEVFDQCPVLYMFQIRPR